MENKGWVSIIVPVYNTARYLPRCVESILRQTYRDIELLLIDDGSTDKSGSICDRYERRDSRVKVLHKKNEGVSVARNIGMEHAAGEFIAFVDSDDWVKSTYIQTLLQIAEEADLAMCALELMEFRRPKYKDTNIETHFDLENPSDLEQFFFTKAIHWGCPVCKLFRADIIRNRHIIFPEGIRNGEDTLFVLDYLYYSRTAVFVESYQYYYNRMVPDSATRMFNREYKETIWRLIEKKQRLYAKPPQEETTTRWKSVWMYDVYQMINYYCRFSDAESFIGIMEQIDEQLQAYNIFLDKERYPVKGYEYDYYRFLSRRDFQGLYYYLRECMQVNYTPNPIKEFIKNHIVRILRWLVFDLQIGYWD